MTPQEIFDTVVTHLSKQGKRSVNIEGDCLYRGPGGLSCAVGCLIPDSEYVHEMEGTLDRLVDLFVTGELDAKVRPVTDELLDQHRDLIDDLHTAHDADLGKGNFLLWLRRAASNSDLNPEIIDDLPWPEVWK